MKSRGYYIASMVSVLFCGFLILLIEPLRGFFEKFFFNPMFGIGFLGLILFFALAWILNLFVDENEIDHIGFIHFIIYVICITLIIVIFLFNYIGS